MRTGPGRLVAAGLRVAELLGEVGDQLGEEQRAASPAAMGRFITDDLRAARARLSSAGSAVAG